MTECKIALGKWFAAHDAYHKASDTYNARVAFVRSERERDSRHLVMTCDQEYKVLNETQRAALAADQELYGALCNGGELEEGTKQ